MLINSFMLAISSSIDSLGIGITYGIKNTKISTLAKLVLFIISFGITLLSIWFGNLLKTILPDFLTKCIGSIILVCMGVFMVFQSLKKEKKIEEKKENSEEKVYQLFIRFLGITIQIIKNPISSDLDDSHSIDSKEALFLGLALSLDSFCIGIGGSMMNLNSILFPFFIATFQLIFMSFGNLLGRKLHHLSHLPDNIWSVLSGLLLITIGFVKYFF